MKKIRDWLRGFSDQDVKTAFDKIHKSPLRHRSKPGEVILLSNREMKAVNFTMRLKEGKP